MLIALGAELPHLTLYNITCMVLGLFFCDVGMSCQVYVLLLSGLAYYNAARYKRLWTSLQTNFITEKNDQ